MSMNEVYSFTEHYGPEVRKECEEVRQSRGGSDRYEGYVVDFQPRE